MLRIGSKRDANRCEVMPYLFFPGLFGVLLLVSAVFAVPIGLYFAFLTVRIARKDVEEIDEARAETPHSGIRDMQVFTKDGVRHRYEDRADD